MPFDLAIEQKPIPFSRLVNVVARPSSRNTEGVSYSISPLDLYNKETNRVIFPELLESCLDSVRRLLFEIRTARWIDDTEWFSSLSSITKHPEFAEIVAMGMPAAKFMLERMVLGDVHVHWFPALKDITGDDPVPPHERGKLPAMTRYWVQWGKRKRLVR